MISLTQPDLYRSSTPGHRKFIFQQVLGFKGIVLVLANV